MLKCFSCLEYQHISVEFHKTNWRRSDNGAILGQQQHTLANKVCISVTPPLQRDNLWCQTKPFSSRTSTAHKSPALRLPRRQQGEGSVCSNTLVLPFVLPLLASPQSSRPPSPTAQIPSAVPPSRSGSLLSPRGQAPFCLHGPAQGVQRAAGLPAACVLTQNSPSPAVPAISGHFLFCPEVYYHLNSLPASWGVSASSASQPGKLIPVGSRPCRKTVLV